MFTLSSTPQYFEYNRVDHVTALLTWARGGKLFLKHNLSQMKHKNQYENDCV